MSESRISFEDLVRRTLGERAESVPPAPPLRFRLHREMAAAAAHGDRVLAGTWRDSTGEIGTEVTETDDNRLRVLITSSEPTVMFVRLHWALVTDSGVLTSRRLVTPLAPGRDGASAGYDLGSVDAADAVDVEPARRIDPATVTPDDVEAAFEVEQLGSARRAWELVAEHPRCPAAVAEKIRSLIDR